MSKSCRDLGLGRTKPSVELIRAICLSLKRLINRNYKYFKPIGHIANSILLVTGGRQEPMAEVFAGNNLETSIAVHTNHHSPSLVP